MTAVAIPTKRLGPARPGKVMQELLGWAERIDFSDPRRRVLRELSLERREILRTLRGIRRSACDRRSPDQRQAVLREQRMALCQIRRAMLALRGSFEPERRLQA